MPATIVSTEVARSAADVFAFATDPTRFHEWQAGVVSGHMEAPGVPSVGALCMTTRRIGFADRSSTSRVTQIDPPGAWEVRGIDGPIRAIVNVAVESLAADKSRLTIGVDFEGHGIGKLLVPLVVRRAARREMPANVAKLRELLGRG
jgi:hypothetical protein